MSGIVPAQPMMDVSVDFVWLVPVLSLVTLLAVAVFAAFSRAAMEARMGDPTAPKSTLAKDGPQGGVGVLIPNIPDQGVNARRVMKSA